LSPHLFFGDKTPFWGGDLYHGVLLPWLMLLCCLGGAHSGALDAGNVEQEREEVEHQPQFSYPLVPQYLETFCNA